MKRSTFITWDQLKVGLVILISMAVLIVAVYRLGKAANLFATRYQLVAFLPNAVGLRVGGQVTLAGQTAGTVRSIDFLPVDGDTTRNLRLVMEVDEALKSQIRADSRGQIRTQGLLGDKILDITPGTLRYGVLDDGDTITMGESLDYDAIIRQASGAVTDMVQLTADLRLITGGIVRGEGTMGQLLTNRALYDELTSTLDKTNSMLVRLQNPNGSVGRLLDDPQLYNNLNNMLVSMDTLVRAMSSNEGTVGMLLRDTTLYAKMTGIIGGMDSVVKTLASGQGTAGKMLTDQQMYDNMNKALADLNAILEDVRRNPGKYTKGLVKVF